MPQREENFYSEEAQDIMGKAPSWVVRWGITVIFIIFMLILLGCYFIKYPEIVEAPVEITTINPPVDLITRYDGLIDTICVENNSLVSKGDLIAVLSNPANYQDVVALEDSLQANYGMQLQELVLGGWIGQEYTLGTLQVAFAAFQSQCLAYRQYLETSYIPNKKRLLQEQIRKNEEYYTHLKEQKLILQKDMEYERRNLERDSMLYTQGVISEAEYTVSRRSMLAKESAKSGFDATLSSTELNIIQTRQQLVELSLQEQNETSEYERSLNAARQQLEAQIGQWREQFVIEAPSSGRVSLLNYWSRHQRIPVGERIATVIPEADTKVIGRMRVPTSGFGKVEVGQTVNVKLNGYPYMEYGVLKGVVTSLSGVPDQQPSGGFPAYIVEVKFPNGLVTSYDKELLLIQQMDGQGEIITKDMRLIERFIQPILSLFKNR